VAGLHEAVEQIGAALEHHLPVSHAAGAALAITDREEILGVVVRGFADAAAATPVRPETRFQIGSISKSFAALIVLQEVEAGRLDPHASVNELLPWLDLPEPFGLITLHHLMTHTSGLAIGTDDAPTSLGAAVALRDLPPTFPPGERFWYSNDAYTLVGLVLERVTGTSIQHLIESRVLAPLAMTSSTGAITDGLRPDVATGYEPVFTDRPAQLAHPLVPAPWTVSDSAAGSIVSNVIDMSAYARMLLNGGEGPSGRLLSEEQFATWTRAHSAESHHPGLGYGYGLVVGKRSGRARIGHSGGMVGYTALMDVEPDSGLGCVILQNGAGDKRALMEHALDVVRACLAGEPAPEPWFPPDPEHVDDPEQYAGLYVGEGSTLQIEPIPDARLRLRVGSLNVYLQRSPLDAPGDVFLVPHPTLERSSIRFGRDPEGEVVEVFHGGEWFRGERYAGADPVPCPPEWDAFPGLYRSDDPWMPVLRVVMRKGALELQWPNDPEEDGELIPVGDGYYGVGEAWTPRRLRFERIVDGRAAVAVFNGARWYRSFEP
jgi:D-alanyl-D-alanine carboxypeptidase